MSIDIKGNTRPPTAPMFIGWSSAVPKPLAVFLAVLTAAIVVGTAALSFLLGARMEFLGSGMYGNETVLLGRLQAKPQPVLRIPPDAAHPKGRALMLSGEGKYGVMPEAEKLDGQMVMAGGFLLQRGHINMLQIGGDIGLKPADPSKIQPYAAPEGVSLGRWRLTGEICDGKCYSGAMRPGNRLAHKACANLCISSGVPPVFVSSDEVEGRSFFMLVTPDGSHFPDSFYDYVAKPVTLEGEIIRVDDLHLFKVDPATIKVF
ncbi:MAG: hypothetical protein K2P80_14555 [Beijerinckiaceae bacterium]|nr:hypothetical protein [Beijerinckiaceae bacterium]